MSKYLILVTSFLQFVPLTGVSSEMLALHFVFGSYMTAMTTKIDALAKKVDGNTTSVSSEMAGIKDDVATMRAEMACKLDLVIPDEIPMDLPVPHGMESSLPCRTKEALYHLNKIMIGSPAIFKSVVSIWEWTSNAGFVFLTFCFFF